VNERRKLTRWQIGRQGTLKIEQLSQETFCQIKDISYKGAKITLNTKLTEDIALKISLKLSENHTIDAEIWVAWHKVVNGTNHYGFYFSEIKDADKDKIFEFISVFYPNDDSREMLKLRVVDAEEERGGEDMNDHRIFERFRKEFSVRFIGLDGKEGVAQTFDVSAKGLGLSTGQELESQANLEIWLDVPNSTDPLYTRGQVVWTKLAGAVGYRSGIELERADLMDMSRLLRA